MKIQMRGGDYIVHTVLVRILAFSCQYNKLCFIAFRIPGGYIWYFTPSDCLLFINWIPLCYLVNDQMSFGYLIQSDY